MFNVDKQTTKKGIHEKLFCVSSKSGLYFSFLEFIPFQKTGYSKAVQ